MRTAIPAAISELRRQLPPSRDCTRDLENLKARLESLEGQKGASSAMPPLEALARRLEALEGRKHEDSSAALKELSQRLEALESAVGGEREHVREIFRDLLDEHDLLLRRLDSRLTLLVQDFHRLAEGQN